jgi:hypothetical protein
VVILDACYSGAVTRSKGARRTVALDLLPFGPDEQGGRAIITSSSPDQQSQESDELHASFFTHALLAGLRGVADVDGDGRITLHEAYEFASVQTIASTVDTLAGKQEPNYDLDLQGRRDIVLTSLPQGGRLRVAPGVEGTLFVRRVDDGRLVLEVPRDAPRPLVVGLAPGEYAVHRPLDREPGFEMRYPVHVSASGVADGWERAGQKRRQVEARLKSPEDGAALSVGYGLSTGWVEGGQRLHSGSVAADWPAGPFRLGVEVRVGHDGGYHAPAEANFVLWEAGALATGSLEAVRFGVLGLGASAWLGPGLASHSVATRESDATHRYLFLRAGAGAGPRLDLGDDWTLGLEARAEMVGTATRHDVVARGDVGAGTRLTWRGW